MKNFDDTSRNNRLSIIASNDNILKKLPKHPIATFLPLFIKYAHMGHPESQYLLGLIYEFGTDTAEHYFDVETTENPSTNILDNFLKAIIFYKRSARSVLSRSCLNLSEINDNSPIVDINYTQSIYWYKKALEQGIKDAGNRIDNLTKAS